MSTAFGELKRVSIRSVWTSEDKHFTPWLSGNLSYLSERIGLDLELVATEVPVGAFRVDVVARVTGTDDIVVIENQFGPTDHDHLGKLLTYAAGQEAAYAIWIAEQFRPEHRSAMEWSNRNSREGVGYFGLRVEALQINDSPVAVQLVTVVEPDQWTKQVAKNTLSLTSKNQLYMRFWDLLLEQIKQTFPGWTSKAVPPKSHWMDLPSGKSYPWYSINFTGDKRLRVELYVDGPDAAAQDFLWAQFVEARHTIDTAIPALSWEPLEEKRASRIALYSDFHASVEEEDEWPTYRAWFIDTLAVLREGLQGQIDKLVTPPPGPVSA